MSSGLTIQAFCAGILEEIKFKRNKESVNPNLKLKKEVNTGSNQMMGWLKMANKLSQSKFPRHKACPEGHGKRKCTNACSATDHEIRRDWIKVKVQFNLFDNLLNEPGKPPTKARFMYIYYIFHCFYTSRNTLGNYPNCVKLLDERICLWRYKIVYNIQRCWWRMKKCQQNRALPKNELPMQLASK